MLNINKINRQKLNFNFYTPIIATIAITLANSWLVNQYSSEILTRNIFWQIIFVSLTGLTSYLNFDNFINSNKNKSKIILIIPIVLLFVIMLFHSPISLAILGLLTLIPFLTNMFSFSTNNGIGLISLAASIGFIQPVVLYYLRNNFLTFTFVKVCLLTLICMTLLLFSFYFSKSENYKISLISILILEFIFSLILFPKTSTILIFLLCLISLILVFLRLKKKYHFYINVLFYIVIILIINSIQ